jgi:hypothetical protein
MALVIILLLQESALWPYRASLPITLTTVRTTTLG